MLEIKDLLPLVIGDMQLLLTSGPLAVFEAYLTTFHKKFNGLFAALNKLVAQKDNRLVYVESWRDKEKEIENAEQQRPDLFVPDSNKTDKAKKANREVLKKWCKKHRVIRQREADLGVFFGSDIFLRSCTLSRQMHICTDKIEKLRCQLKAAQSYQWKKNTYSDFRQQLRDVIGAIEGIIELVGELETFTQSDNLNRIAQWYELHNGVNWLRSKK